MATMKLKIKHQLVFIYVFGGSLLLFTTICSLIYFDKLNHYSNFIHNELLPLQNYSKEIRLISLDVYDTIEIDLLDGKKIQKESLGKKLSILSQRAQLITNSIPDFKSIVEKEEITKEIFALHSEVNKFIKTSESIKKSMTQSTGVGTNSDVIFDALYDDIVKRLETIAHLKDSQKPKTQFKIGNARYLLAHGHLITAEILSGDLGEDFNEVTNSFNDALKEINSLDIPKVNFMKIKQDIQNLSKLAVERYNIMIDLLTKRKAEIKNFDMSFKQFNKNAVRVDKMLKISVKSHLNNFAKNKQQAQIVMYSVSIIGVLAIFIFSLYSIKQVFVPFISLTGSIKDLQEGSLIEQVQGLDRDDEIGDMARVVEGLQVAETERSSALSMLTIATKEAQQANIAKSQFLANMSHEIRTPLNSIIGYSDILVDDEISLEQRNMANSIKNSSETLLALVNDVLDLAKVESGEMTFEEIPINLEDLIFEVSESQVSKLTHKQVEINVEFDDVYALIYSDPTKLKQILMNLIGNAVKFTETGEIVTSVKVIHEDEQYSTLRISVRDTGIGMTEKQTQVIFEAFKQADGSTSRKFGGTGLGLNITKKILENMGSKIEVISHSGEGSDFYFNLTFKKHYPDAPEVLPSLTELQGKSILVVDDNPTAKNIMASYLALVKLKCSLASSAEEALIFLANNKVDILIQDLMMPLVDGYYVAKEVRENYPEIKLIAATADISAKTVAKVKEHEFDAYMLKPIRRKIVYQTLLHLYIERKEEVIITEDQIDNQFFAQHLLIVDDNLMNLKLADKIFTKMGHCVETVDSGQLALEKINEKDFDIIFMDMQMPEMSGVETTKAIRDKHIHTPIIALTANAFESDKQECLSAGMNDFTTKPLRRNELHRLIQKYSNNQGEYIEKKILIVEDDSTTSTVIYTVLENSFPGAIIKQAYNGLEALSMIGSFRPNILILDFMLPDIDGLKVMEFLRSHEQYKDVKVLVNSSLEVDDERICKIKEMGAVGVLCKNNFKDQLIEYFKYL
jgi:signal transduction histidine kinase/DNA-binding response OmpR family regulator